MKLRNYYFQVCKQVRSHRSPPLDLAIDWGQKGPPKTLWFGLFGKMLQTTVVPRDFSPLLHQPWIFHRAQLWRSKWRSFDRRHWTEEWQSEPLCSPWEKSFVGIRLSGVHPFFLVNLYSISHYFGVLHFFATVVSSSFMDFLRFGHFRSGKKNSKLVLPRCCSKNWFKLRPTRKLV